MGIDCLKFLSAHFYERVLVKIAQTFEPDIMFCNIRGECKGTPDGKNCMAPTPEEAIEILEVIITFAILADALRGAVVLKICGGKKSFCHVAKAGKKIKIIGVAHVFLRIHQLTHLLYARPPSVLDLQGLSPAVFAIGGS